MKNLNQEFNLLNLNETNFGATIRKLREEQGLKIYELAEKTGTDRTYITKIEKHNKLPSFFVMKKISDLLHNPGLLEAYIKIKCSSFFGKGVKVKNALETQEIQGAPIRKGLAVGGIGKEYLLEVKVGEGDIIKKIFGNDLGYNEVSISFKNKIQGIVLDPKIAKVDKLGIVIATDGPFQGVPPNFGFHNYFIPWSEINYIYQYIAT
ncbi:MAG: helix-turn-helix domain-containing protein [Candidatus Omnitrophica bacterium]|nr:helix-turn-helix domain-containing protein [Candidatus Omnitrophota bacterium]